MSNTVFTYLGGTTSYSSDITLTSSSYNSTPALVSVVVGTVCTSISSICFQNRTNLTSVTFNLTSQVTSLGAFCFFGCSNLASITIPHSVTSLGNQCFQNCTKLTTIIYNDPLKIKTIGTTPFASSTPITVNFYSTTSAPSAPSVVTGTVYNTSLYANGSTFNYYSSTSCYNKGTNIVCLINKQEQFVAIEDLKVGDLVKTYLHDYLPIQHIGQSPFRNNSLNNNISCMYQIDDLYVTGGHFVLVDKLPDTIDVETSFYQMNLTIDDKYCLLVSDYDQAKKLEQDEIYTIYHLVLQGDQERYGIYVKRSSNEILLSESTTASNFIKHGFY